MNVSLLVEEIRRIISEKDNGPDDDAVRAIIDDYLLQDAEASQLPCLEISALADRILYH